MNYRVVAFDPPFSDRRMILTRPLQVSGVFSLNDLSSLELTYPEGQANYDAINPDKDYPAELCLEYFNPETDMWEEPLDARYIMLKASGDNSEEHPVRKFSALSIKWLLRKTKVWSAGGDEGDERIFRDVSIGSLLKTILNEAYARGIKIAHPDNIGFTDTLDSAGSSWGGTVSMSFPINMSLEEVFNNLVEQGYIDWAMSGRRILVWKADSTSGLARDRRNITLDNVFGTTSSPEDVSYDSLMTDARVLGETQSWSFSNNLSTPWGRLEDIISQAGVDDPITAEEATQKILLEGERPSRTHTKELAGTSMVQPFRDIRPGDWVNAQVHRDRSSTSSYEEMRIQEISLDISGRHFTWNVTMGDRTSDILEKIARKQSALSGGSSGGTSRTPSGSPGGSSSQVGDWRVPTTPLNFSVKVSSHLDADTNRYKGRAVFNWFDDGMGIDPEDQTLSPQARRGYEVQYRVVGTTDYTTLAWYGPDASSSPQIYYPLDVINPQTKNPYSYEFRLRTLGAEEHSAYTNAVVVMMLADTTPPSKPSKPTTQAYLGTISVTTDLKTSTGGEFELDFSHLIVESRHYADSEVVRAVGEIYGNALILPGLTENTNYEFRFIAVDTAGNRSTPSDWSAPVAVQPLVDSASIQSALEQSQMLLDESVRETQARFSELNTYLDSAFADIETDIGEAVFAASSPNIFSQDTPPVDPKEGYLWFDTDNNNLASVWDGSRWVPLRDGAIEDLQSALSTKSTTHFSSTPPTTPDYGDLWFNPSKNNEVRRWDGNDWALVTDPKIQEALTTAQRAEEAADGKIQTFLGPEPPTGTGYGEGDLWFDSNDGNRLYRWNATSKTWEDARDRSIGEFHAWQSDLISALEDGEYGRVSTYYQDTAPTGPMPGDLWVDTSSNGTLKIWNSSTSKWDAVTDPSLKTALENVGRDVEAIQDSVIHTYVQPSAPTQNLSVGDLWFDSDDNNKLWRYSGTAWVVVQDKTITALQSAVATKVTTFYGSTTPTGASNGDLWFNSAAGNEVKRFNNGSWIVVTDPRIATALSTANTAKATADGKIQSFYQPEEPTGAGLGLGDIWFDSNDGNKMYRYNPASSPKWVPAQDKVLSDLPAWQNSLINDLKAGTYSRVSTYYQNTAPTSPRTGDLWVDTANNSALKTWNGASWVAVTDPVLMSTVTDLGNDVEAIKDGVIETFIQPTEPVSTTQNKLAEGDLWFDSDDNNKMYRYSGTAWVVIQDKNIDLLRAAVNTKVTTFYGSTTPTGAANGDLWFNSAAGNEVKRYSNGSWILVTDTKIQAALNTANDAKATADGKIQTFFQPTAPTSADLGVGDLWFDSDDGNKMYRYDPAANPKWVPAQDKFISNFSAWESAFINSIKAGDYARVSTFYQTTAPTKPLEGDLWMDTNTGVLKRWNSSTKTWDLIQDSDLKASIIDLGTDLEAIQDSVIHTYVQSTKPTGTLDRPLSVGDLWFDSANGNKLHRYGGPTPGWVPVSDTSITDAVARSIPIIIHSTSAASTTSTAASGSTWFQHLPTINGPVVAQWTKDGSNWVPVTVSSEVIANLDVGKLTAGTANLSTAVVNKLFANIFAAKKITATELSVAPDSLFPDPLFEASAGYAPWSVVSGGLELTGNGKQIGSYFNSLTISVTPGEEYMFSMDKTTLPTVGLPSDVTMYARSYDADGNMIALGIVLLRHNTTDKTVTSTWTAPDNVAYIMVGFFSNSLTATGTQVRISNILAHKRVGGVLIKDGAVIAEHITASASLTAKVAQFLKVTADMIEANTITSSHLEAGSVKAQHMNFEGPISAGGGYQLTIDSTGIRFYYVTDADNDGVINTAAGDTKYLVTSLTGTAGGENGALYSIVDKDTGNTLASMTEGGDINAIQGNFENDISLSGRTMLGSDGILDDLPKGVVFGSVGYRFLKGTVAAGDWGFLETSFLADPNRVYKVITEGFSLRNTESDSVVFRIRYTTDGSTPNFSSPVLGSNWVDNYYVSTDSSTIFIPGQSWLIRTPSDIPSSHIVDGMIQYRLLFQLYTYRGGFHFYDDLGSDFSRFKTWVEDMGRNDPGLLNYTNRDLFYPSRFPGTGTQPVETNPPTPKVLKSKTYYVSTHKNYYANWPGPTSGGEYVWSTYTTKNLFLGSYSGAKDIWSFGLLPNMTTELSGADIKSATITFKVNHTYSTTGSNVAVWMNGNSSLGSTMPSSLGTMVKNVLGAKRGSTYSVAVPSSMYAGLKSGQFRAISFGFNSNVSDSVYAYVDKASIRLKIDYYK